MIFERSGVKKIFQQVVSSVGFLLLFIIKLFSVFEAKLVLKFLN